MLQRIAVLLFALLAFPATAAAALPEDARYTLAGGCFTSPDLAGGAPLRLQATALGEYLLRTKDLGSVLPDGGTAPEPSEAAVMVIDVDGDRYAVTPKTGGATTRTSFTEATGCATLPEPEINAQGAVQRGATAFGEVEGLLDLHTHLMHYEFIGGQIHCGRPWHPYGAPAALVDCPDHAANGSAAAVENVFSYGSPVAQHDPVGWPSFKDWPAWNSLTHEQQHWRWMERAWRGGLRLMVTLAAENELLCSVYPLKRNSCNEMDGVRLQIKRLREYEAYVDAQFGGPGKGFLRIVTDPFEARRVINDGKLAVIIGIETGKLFGCGVQDGRAECTKEDIDRGLEEVKALGVRDLELFGKTDNAFGGVAMDAGPTGVALNTSNKLETGRFWSVEQCTSQDADRAQLVLPVGSDLVANGLSTFLPQGTTPVYGEGPHCNKLGLTPLGEHVIRRIMDKQIVLDVDHMAVAMRRQALSIVEAAGYSGVVSSHSWADLGSYERVAALGGVIGLRTFSPTFFNTEWAKVKERSDPRFRFGIGYAADAGGLGAQSRPPQGGEPTIEYPFTASDGKTRFDRQQSGTRTFDLNQDGVAHYGLYPDWVEQLRKTVRGDELVEDMRQGPEAYLQMWERTYGVAATSCLPARARVTRRGISRVALSASPEALLRSAGQPAARPGARWTWCVTARDGRPAGRVRALLAPGGATQLAMSTAPEHEARGVGRGDRATLLRGTRTAGSGVRTAPAGGGARYVWTVRRGRVVASGVARGSVTKTTAALRKALRRTGLATG